MTTGNGIPSSNQVTVEPIAKVRILSDPGDKGEFSAVVTSRWRPESPERPKHNGILLGTTVIFALRKL